jgi:filamentous hemagglutinin family protein
MQQTQGLSNKIPKNVKYPSLPKDSAYCRRFWGALELSATLLLSLVVSGNEAIAQIAPDASLGGEGSTLQPNLIINGIPSTRIDGGTIRGTNLFHSFLEFNVEAGQGAYFTNPAGIENIFSRVTGGTPSNIFGTLGVLGNANLFLLNPNGIIFGQSASLDVKGSFLATTANSINFADGTTFSATNSQVPPLLTVSVPVGLGFGNNPGAIQMQGTGHSLTVASVAFPLIDRGNNTSGLRVQPGKTLALVGGDIALDGGILTTEGGRIELGSVRAGQVSLNPVPQGWTLGYESVQKFQNITLRTQSLVDASGVGSGSIQVQGAKVSLSDGSIVLIQNQGIQSSGSILVNASESLELSGTNLNPEKTVQSGLNNQTVGGADGGDIVVSTERLVIQDGAAINARTFFNAGKGGNITVNASESVQLSGFSPINPFAVSTIATTTNGSGNGGNITLSAGQLTLRNGANMGAGTASTGAGGDVVVNATDSVELIGANPISFFSSALTTSTLNSGNAGSLTVNTRRLLLRDGGRVDASTFVSGKAGSVTINASKLVEVSGTVPGSLNPSLIISSANILDEQLRLAFGLPDVPSGDSGNVTINTNQLRVTDGAQVTVRNDGTGRAGTLTVNARSIFLDNQGGITAVSGTSGERENEANITLNVRDSLQMRRNSLISAEARGDQKGGNITINAGAIAAVPNENSDITASAPQGTGGRITINTQGIFGFKVTQEPTLTSSDITAFGKAAELNGTVQVNTPDINVQSALNAQESNFVNPDEAIANSCLARRNIEQGSFTVTGTGGLPQNPYDALSGRYAVTDVQGLPTQTRQQTSSPIGGLGRQGRNLGNSLHSQLPAPWKLGNSIVEAQGMTVTADGRIIVGTTPQLVAATQPRDLICHTSAHSTNE